MYILTNRSGTLYVGVTNDLERRMAEHAAGKDESFAERYALDRLIYVEPYSDIRNAIGRERQLKGWRRTKKVTLVNRENPTWRDLRASPDPEEPPCAVGRPFPLQHWREAALGAALPVRGGR